MGDLLSDPDFTSDLAALAVGIMSLAVTVASYFLARFANVKVEEKHQKAFHEAAVTWTENAVRQGTQVANAQAVEDFKEYASKSVPDAMAWLKPGGEVLSKVLGRYLGQRLL